MPSITHSESAWYDYPDDPQGGRVKIRWVKDGEIQDISAKLSRQRLVNPTDDENQEVIIEPRDDKLSLAGELAVAAVTDWENFNDGVPVDGKPYGEALPCNEITKRQFCMESDFVSKISKLHKEHKRRCLKHQKDLEKN